VYSSGLYDTFVITDCNISGNSAEYGGGIYGNDTSPKIINCIISNNTSRWGGGINCVGIGYPRVTNCSIINNTAEDDGGGVYVSGLHGTFVITDCNISGNSAEYGGGIYGNGTLAVISKCLIQANTCEKAGGGINGINGMISHCTITGNTATSGGGLDKCHGKIVNCLIADNTAENVAALNNCDGYIINCTITSNTAGTDGVLRGCDGTITNCIIWANSPDTFTNHTAAMTYSCWPDGTTGTGNINTEPEFIDADYHLPLFSPCIDAGDPNCVPVLNEKDLNGNPRVIGSRVDMGAYELAEPWPQPQEPYIWLEPAKFTFHVLEDEENPADQILKIRNVGIGSLAWEISENCSWLQVFPDNGETTTETDEIALHLDISGLHPEVYNCKLTISGSAAANFPRTVDIMLNLYPEKIGTLLVPVEHATIQAAIDVALDGDTIIVGAGIYNENINFSGKNIILSSLDPNQVYIVANTVINGSSVLDSVVTFAGSETSNCQLTGLTITGGYASVGGGIRGYGTQAGISRCIIRDNIAEGVGGGIHRCDGIISVCRVIANRSNENVGGGLAGCHGTITNCLIADNTAEKAAGLYNCDGEIINCTITSNTASYEGVLNGCDGSFTNSIIWGNSPDTFTEHTATMTYSCWPNTYGANGNTSDEPLFVDADNGDYHLLADSPCVDAGTDAGVYEDIEGNVRPFDGDSDGIIVCDIGTYEFVLPTDMPIIVAAPRKIRFYGFEGSSDPEPQVLSIWNGGAGSIDWDIIYDCGWLEVEPVSGSITDEVDEVTLRVLSIGRYDCELVISDPHAANHPQIVHVSVGIYPQGSLVVPGHYPTIQAAIDAAVDGDTVIVEDGTYAGPGNQGINFNGKAIIVRSENGPENCIIDRQKVGRAFRFKSGEGADSVIDGFTITNGLTSGSGGAIRCWEGSSPTITNCIIENNTTLMSGGGIYCDDSSPKIINCIMKNNTANDGGGISCSGGNPVITNCIIKNNTAEDKGGGVYHVDDIHSTFAISDCNIIGNSAEYGGGIYGETEHSSTIIVTGCTIRNNAASSHGGGSYWKIGGYATLNVTNCKIAGNQSNSRGGGIYLGYMEDNSMAVIDQCIITDNLAGGSKYEKYDRLGSMIYCDSSVLTVRNSTIVGNTTNCQYYHWGYMHCGDYTNSEIYCDNSQLSITNSIYWNNQFLNGHKMYFKNSTVEINYSDIQGGQTAIDKYDSVLNWGAGNIETEPGFVDPGYWDLNGTPDEPWDDFWVEGDYHLSSDSPCIDAGDPNYAAEPNETDLDDNPRVIHGRIDMGAYELAEPVFLLDFLAQDIIDLELQQGIETSLFSKLDTAREKLEDDNENNDIAAINSLQAFINFVESQRGKKISQADADALIAAAQEIIELLSDEQN